MYLLGSVCGLEIRDTAGWKPALRLWEVCRHRPTTRISSRPGPPRPPPLPLPGWSVLPAGGGDPAVEPGAGSVVINRIRLFWVSKVQVLARDLVCTVCSTSKLVGLFSLMMVSVPSPCELKASRVFGRKQPQRRRLTRSRQPRRRNLIYAFSYLAVRSSRIARPVAGRIIAFYWNRELGRSGMVLGYNGAGARSIPYTSILKLPGMGAGRLPDCAGSNLAVPR